MTRTITQQFHGLRILALFGAFAITAAAALGQIGDAAAHGPAGDQDRPGNLRQTQAPLGGRVVIPGVSTGDSIDHVDGSGGRGSFSPQVPASSTPDATVVVPPAAPSTTVTASPTVTAPSTTTPVTPAANEPVATPSLATPSPTVVAPPAYTGACPALIYNSLGIAGCKISFCESGWRANAVGLSGELGWFQVHPRWHSDATLEPAGNVAAAVRISNGGTNWSPWSVRSVLTTGRCPNGTIPPV